MSVVLEKTFELLSQDEWDNYLSVTIFDDMRIDIDKFSKYKDRFMLYRRLGAATTDLVNKVGELLVTYSLCKHYFDKGIPDDPWYISPGKNGESVQYFPEFQTEHYMRRYWFNYFASSMYLRFFSYWDEIMGLINIFYGIDESIQDHRFRQNVMKKLKESHSDIFDYLTDILNDPIYKEANEYRTCFVHGQAPSEVTNEYSLQKDVETELIIVVDGKIQVEKVKAATVFSASVGDYVKVSTVMTNIEAFAVFSGQKIKTIIQIMIT